MTTTGILLDRYGTLIAVAGTTRDLLTEAVMLHGARMTLVDTAGMRTTTDAVEREGVSRAEKAIAARYAGDRLPNVKQVTATIEDLKLIPASQDAAIFIMSYHDLYWRPDDGSWPATDPLLLHGKLYEALKPGGLVVVEDHVANPGGEPDEVVADLHRIDPSLVKRDFARAGFVFDGESRLLANPEDDHTRLVFDEAIRGRTDRFLFRFRKPMSKMLQGGEQK